MWVHQSRLNIISIEMILLSKMWQVSNMKTPFRKVKTFAGLSDSQLKELQKSYNSYKKTYLQQGQSFERIFNEEEYFEAYKVKYRELKSQNKTLAAIPRQIAAEQKYERSLAQDRAQFKALKESDNFKKLHGDMLLKDFRRMSSDDLADLLWEEIDKNRAALKASGMTEAEVDLFISQYYFGSI